MAAPILNYVSPTDYLIIEQAAKDKHELHQGRVVAMAGASLAHNEIVSNVFGVIKSFLKGNSCRIYPSDLRIHIPSSDSFTYPDLSIVCGKPEMLDGQFDTITNPTVILEVMSPSTEQYDRGTKFFYYMQIPSLKEYILISSSNLYIQTASKQTDGSWKFDEITDNNASLSIQTIGNTIGVNEIYENVKF